MRPLPSILAALAVLAAAPNSAQAPKKEEAPRKVSISVLLKERDAWHSKPVVVVGKVEDFEAKTSRKGNKYTILKLSEGALKISVWSRGHLPSGTTIKNGERAQVTGIFRKEKKVGPMTFKNEVDATPIKGRPYGIKALKDED